MDVDVNERLMVFKMELSSVARAWHNVGRVFVFLCRKTNYWSRLAIL